MPFLGPPFDHDIFVSYAHGRGGDLKHWSRCLVERLKRNILDLAIEIEEPDIFIDLELDPAKRLTDQLQGKVRASGLLLIIMSDHYLQSAWCKDELEWFESELEACQKEGGLVLVVRALPTDHQAWPASLKDHRGHVDLGFKFHPDPQKPDDIVFPYGWPEPQLSDRDFYKELGKLLTIVVRRLRDLKARQELIAKTDQPRVQISIEGEPNIYLQAPPGETEDWQRTKQIMETAGCKVLPEVLPSAGADLKAMQEARKQRIQILNNDAHALCLLGSNKANGQDPEIEAIANDRIALQAFGKDLPVALLHRGQGNPTLANELGIDAIDAAGDDWLIRFQGWLHQALAAETAS